MEMNLLIGGELMPGEGAALSVENPFTQRELAEIASASAAQVAEAVLRAREGALRWSALTAGERGELLKDVATGLRGRTGELAELMTLEGGKPLVENRDEVGWTAAAFDYYAEIARSSEGTVIPPIESTQLALVLKEPLGVVACIVPWNYPLLLLAWKLAPALAAGNAVIAKPSELTPLSTLALAPLFAEFPAGTVSILAGAGDVGEALVSDERVDGVAFTGSVATGIRINEICARRVARVNLELGGKDPFIVCADIKDDIEVAARGGAWAAYLNSGQVCTSAERFYVMDEIHDDYVAAFVEHAESLTLGDPLLADTDLGPMASDAQRAKVIAQLEQATSSGAEIITGGVAGGHPTGYFLAPAVVTGAGAETQLLSEETFGPVAPIVRVGSIDEAIALANSTRFGLGANVYTRDLRTAMRCVREIKSGTVWIDDPLTDNDAGPFGGFKQSGLGRELGREGLEAFQETKHAHIESVIERKEWWYPYSEYSG